jgi:hypothetical protein
LIPPRAPLPPVDAADYAARLAIIVPYRDRQEHLTKFIPHLVTYFERDRFAKAIPYEIHIAEQGPGKPFNRGAMKNAGFAIAHANADYVVFHDVDYLPIWADYSRVHEPTSLITWGVDGSSPGEPSNTPGCVVALPVDDVVRINGYSNDYWGWGFEDVDLKQRMLRNGLRWTRRDGSFTALPHLHHGVTSEGKQNNETMSTRAIYLAKGAQGDAGYGSEGLSTLRFRVERSLNWSKNGVPQRHVFHHHIVLE